MKKTIRLYSVLCSLNMAAWLVLPALPADAKDAASDLDIVKKINDAFIAVADQVSPAVVVIRVAYKADRTDPDGDENPLFEMFPPDLRRRLEEEFDRQRRQPRRSPRRAPLYDGQGSGVVIREDGYILTNRHVVDGADKIQVRFKDGTSYQAEIRGVDPQSDVAVLKIEAKNLAVAKLADSSKTRVGEFAIAIGAPFNLDYSVTFGHVSAKGRHVIPGEEGAAMDQDFIQTDANINPGNSGGPLVNLNGEVIGINTLIRGLNTGIGFAIPVNLAKEIADQLIAEGKFTRAWLGVGIASLSEFEDKDLIGGVKEGVVIREIRANTPAANSDLKPLDVVTAVDGKPVKTSQQLKSEIRTKRIGGSVTLDVVRNGKPIKVRVKPEAWPEENLPVANRGRNGDRETSSDLGLTVKALSKDLAKEYDVDMTEGVIVTEVERGSEAEARGFKAGDIITEIDQKQVASPKEFRDAMKKADPKKGVIINLVSKGVSKFEVLKESGD